MKKLLIAVIILPVLTVTLSGCAPQSRDSLNRYTAVLQDVEGVTNIDVGVSTPLPFTVQGTLHVDFEGTSEQLKQFYETSCATEVNASARLEVTVTKNQTTATHDVYPCKEVPVNLVEIADTYSTYNKTIQVSASEYQTNGSFYVSQENITFDEALQYAETAQQFITFNPQINLEIDDRMQINADLATHQELLQTLKTLNQSHAIKEAEYHNTLLVTLPAGTTETTRQEAAALLQKLPYGNSSTVIVDGTGTVTVTAPANHIALQQKLNTLTYTEATSANGYGVTASVLSYTDLETLIIYVAENNPDNVPVNLQLIRNDKNRDTDLTVLSSNTYWTVNQTTNDYTTTLLPRYTIMAESKTLSSVEFQKILISARLKENLRTNTNAFTRAAESMNTANKDNKFDSLWLNGQEV